MLRWLKRLFLAVVILLAVAQVYHPARTNPPVDPKREIGANLSIDPRAGSMLERSSSDCHSNRTIWPWYSGVAPASWLVVSDVNRGRKELNFSTWASYGPVDQRKQLSENLQGNCGRRNARAFVCALAFERSSRKGGRVGRVSLDC